MSDRTRKPGVPAEYLQRARLALRVLSRSGLGDMNWIGPNWICAFGDMDHATLRFLSVRIRQDTRLRHTVRGCRKGRELRRVQEAAICRAMREYSTITGRPAASLPDVLPEHTIAPAPPLHMPRRPAAPRRGHDA